MNTSEKIDEIAAALANFQNNVPTIAKNKTAGSGSYSYKYADIADVLTSIRSKLAENGLSVSQMPENENSVVNNVVSEYIVVTTRLMHTSGQWIESSLKGSLSANQGRMSNMQAVGSITTYLRRYSLAAMLGLATDDDVDGNISGDGQSNVEAEIENYRASTSNFLSFIYNEGVVSWIRDYESRNRGLEQAKKANRIAVIENAFCVKAMEVDKQIVLLSEVMPEQAEKFKSNLYDIQSKRVKYVEEEGKCTGSLEKLAQKVSEELEKVNQG